MSELTVSQKRAIAGSKGGKKLVKKYGKRYMRKIAKWGAHRMHSTYRLEPVALNDFALVHRETNEIKAYLSGRKPDPSIQVHALAADESGRARGADGERS